MYQLKENIRNAKLTKTGKRIAEYILDNDTEACFMTSTELASRLCISEASVIRFSRALGFTGYMDFQKNLRDYYTEKINRVSNAITIPHERLRASIEHTNADYIETSVLNTETNIKSILKNNSHMTFDQAIELLCISHRKYITATRANSGVAAYFFLLLKHMLSDVYSTGDSSISVIDHLCDIDRQDCMILFSFPRYSELDRQALQMAKDAGAAIILITDKASSPLAQDADVLITVDVDTGSFFNSYVAVQLVTEILCAGLSCRLGAAGEEKLRHIDKYLEKLGTY